MKLRKFLISLFLIIACLASCFMIGCGEPSNNNDDDGDNNKTPDNNTETVATQREEYVTLFSDITSELWELTGYTKPTTASLYSFKAPIDTDTPEVTDAETIKAIKSQIIPMGAVIELISNLYKNENFVVSDNPITFTGDVTLLGMTNTYTMSILPFIDKENNMVYLDWYSAYPMIGMPDNPVMVEYDYVEIGYDFENSKILSFRFLTRRGYSAEFMAYQEYGLTTDGKAFASPSEPSVEFKNTVDTIANAFLALKSTSETVLADKIFNEEFQIYSQTLYSIMFS